MRDVETGATSVNVPPDGIQAILNAESGTLLLPGPNLPGSDVSTSRFLAKVAVESLAQCLQDSDEFLNETVDKPELEAIKGHTRFGKIASWPVSVRTTYDESTV